MDKLAIWNLFAKLLAEYATAADMVECEWGSCNTEKNVTPKVEEYHDCFDALLSADDWCRWPGDEPTCEMEVWVYYPDRQPGEEDYWVVRQAQCSPWRAEHHDGNPFGWWDECAEHWAPCIGVAHWMEIEKPEPPEDEEIS